MHILYTRPTRVVCRSLVACELPPPRNHKFRRDHTTGEQARADRHSILSSYLFTFQVYKYKIGVGQIISMSSVALLIVDLSESSAGIFSRPVFSYFISISLPYILASIRRTVFCRSFAYPPLPPFVRSPTSSVPRSRATHNVSRLVVSVGFT